MQLVFCLVPVDKFFKPSALGVAEALDYMLAKEYIDNDEVYLDIRYESGHARPGTSNLITVEEAIAELEQVNDLEVTDFAVENIRGTARIPGLFENVDQQNLSLMGWLAARTYEEVYPLFDTEEEYYIRCGFCGHEASQREWGEQDRLRICPNCGRGEQLHLLDFFPKVEFARFILEISELVFADTPPVLSRDQKLVTELEDTLGTELKPVWYHM